MSPQKDLLNVPDASEEDESDLGSTDGEATLWGTDWTVGTIVRQIEQGRIDLAPPYQRRDAWTDGRKSQFIESLLLSLPIPQIVLAERKDKKGTFIVIDGKQRLTSISRFVSHTDDPTDHLRLRELTILKQLNGFSWRDFNEQPDLQEYIPALENQPIRTVVIRQWPNESYLYLVFLRLNTGSVPLSPQELRQALHPGPFVQFVQEYSATSIAIPRALGIDKPDFRMRDVELLVRFLAFALFLPTYRGNLKSLLDDTCNTLNERWAEREHLVHQLAQDCDTAISTTIEIFDEEQAFCRFSPLAHTFERRFNRAVFDVMTFYFKNVSIASIALTKKEEIRDRFIALCNEDSEFNDSLQTTTKSLQATYRRLHIWGNALSDILNQNIPVPIFRRNRIHYSE